MGSSPPLTRAGLLQRVFFLDAPCSSLPSLHSPHSSREQSLPFSNAQKLPGSSRSPPQLPPWRHTSPLAPPPCSSLCGETQRPLPRPAPTRGAATAPSLLPLGRQHHPSSCHRSPSLRSDPQSIQPPLTSGPLRRVQPLPASRGQDGWPVHSCVLS
jgi:hypothetical protein